MSAQEISFKRAGQSADPTHEVPSTPEGDALERLARLQEEYRGAPHQEAPAPEPAAEAATARITKLAPARKGIKSLLAIAVAIAIGWIPVQRVLATTSTEATVNARVINLRAPIDGTVLIQRPLSLWVPRSNPASSSLRLQIRARTAGASTTCAVR